MYINKYSSDQSLSRVGLIVTPWVAARQASLSITNSQSSLKLMPTESVMPSSHLILCHPPLLLPLIPPSIRVFPMSQSFSWGGRSTGVSALASFLPKKSQGWSPSEWAGCISLCPSDSQESSPTPHFKSINSSALSFLHSPTLMTTGKIIALTRWIFVGKVVFLLFNKLSRFWRLPWWLRG